MKRPSLLSTALALVALVALVAAGGILATHAHRGDDARAATTTIAPVPPGTAAMRAYRNPETGALEVGAPPSASATGALDPELQNALRRDGEGLVEKHHADGAVSIDLEGRFQSVTVLKRGPNGNTVVCTDNVRDTERALHAPQDPSTLEVK